MNRALNNDPHLDPLPHRERGRRSRDSSLRSRMTQRQETSTGILNCARRKSRPYVSINGTHLLVSPTDQRKPFRRCPSSTPKDSSRERIGTRDRAVSLRVSPFPSLGSLTALGSCSLRAASYRLRDGERDARFGPPHRPSSHVGGGNKTYSPFASSQRSASMAAMQPVPAAVTA
jgi:hypothetical protein